MFYCRPVCDSRSINCMESLNMIVFFIISIFLLQCHSSHGIRCVGYPVVENATTDVEYMETLTQSYTYEERYIYCSYDSYGNRQRCQRTAYRMISQPKSVFYGGNLTINCRSGYEYPDGTSTSQLGCSADGNWIYPPVECQPKDCGIFPALPGVTCDLKSTKYPTISDCECKLGYERIYSNYGNRRIDNSFTISCLPSGRWSRPDDSRAPNCTRVQCPAPNQISNMVSVTYEGHGYDDNATYTCTPGYETDLNNTIWCQANRTWSHSVRCVRKDCGTPPEIDNGHLTHYVYKSKFQSNATYACIRGYVIDGDTMVKCVEEGTWTEPPVCHRIRCGDPPSIENGRRAVGGHYYNDVTTYQCNVGYSLAGNSTVSCQFDGHWTARPECHGIRCNNPPLIENGRRRVGGHYYNDVTTYQCNVGYSLAGNSTIYCQFDGHWTTTPECHGMRCNDPPLIENSRRRVGGQYYNDVTTYQCDLGYSLAGNSTIYCQFDGHWTARPDCHIISCGSPPQIAHGSFRVPSGYSFRHSVEYFCSRDYILNGVNFITCLSDGTWSSAPRCLAIGEETVDPRYFQLSTATVNSIWTHMLQSKTVTIPSTRTSKTLTAHMSTTPITTTIVPIATRGETTRTIATTTPTTTAATTAAAAAATTATVAATTTMVPPATAAAAITTAASAATTSTAAASTATAATPETPTSSITTPTTSTDTATPFTTTASELSHRLSIKPSTSSSMIKPSVTTVSEPITIKTFASAAAMQWMTNVKFSSGPSTKTHGARFTSSPAADSTKLVRTSLRPSLVNLLISTQSVINLHSPSSEPYTVASVVFDFRKGTKDRPTSSSHPPMKDQTMSTLQTDTATVFMSAKHQNNGNSEKNSHSPEKHQSQGLVIGCAILSIIVVILVGIFAFWRVWRIRKRRSHCTISATNALYSSEGETMTIYSFKSKEEDEE